MVDRELGILMHFQHPTIIPFYGFSPIDFHKEKQFTIFMEEAKKGSLASILRKSRQFLADPGYDQTARQIILIGIARGMMYLHKHHIIHRDLKPGNILLDENFHPYITDFGISKSYETQDYKNQTKCCGTPAYMAPEVMNGNEYNAKVDVYSFGILMYEVVTDCEPYPDIKLTNEQLIDFLKDPSNRPKFTVFVKDSIKKLIEQCWAQNPNDRPTFNEIFNKLAFNEDESIYDINFNLDDEKTNIDDYKYYLDGVDIYDLVDYIDEINDNSNHKQKQASDSKVDELVNQIECLSKSNEEFDKQNKENLQQIKLFKKQIDSLKKENKELKSQLNEYKIEFQQIHQEHEDISDNMRKFEQRLLFREEITSDVFNSLSLKSQQFIISKTLTNSSVYSHKCYKALNKLLLYLLHDNPNNFCFLEITTNSNQLLFTEDSLPLEKITLLSDATEYLFKNKSFESDEFILIIKDIENLHFELKYPSKKFSKVYDMILKINNSTTNKVKIALFISDIQEIDLTFQKNINIGSIIIDSSVKKIADSAFSECTSLTDISLPSSMTNIGRNYFNSFVSLRRISIPSSVTFIDDLAFSNCTSLIKIIIPNSVRKIGCYCFSECKSLNSIYISSNLKVISKGSFRGCSSLKEIKIPSSVTTIEEEAFSGCLSLKEISIPDSVISIGDNAFSLCLAATKLIIPSSLNSIGSCTFYGCSSLKFVSIPPSIKSVGDKAFFGCSSLNEITIPSTLKSIGEKSFPDETTITSK